MRPFVWQPRRPSETVRRADSFPTLPERCPRCGHRETIVRSPDNDRVDVRGADIQQAGHVRAAAEAGEGAPMMVAGTAWCTPCGANRSVVLPSPSARARATAQTRVSSDLAALALPTSGERGGAL